VARPRSICLIRGVRFHSTATPRGTVARILCCPGGPAMPQRLWSVGQWCECDAPCDRDRASYRDCAHSASRGHDRQVRATRTQAQDQRRHLPPPGPRHAPADAQQDQGPGRATGERLCIQRGRLTPRTTSSSEKPLPGRRQPYDPPAGTAASQARSTNQDRSTRLLTQRGLVRCGLRGGRSLDHAAQMGLYVPPRR
jgi:hypothetical protein